MLTFASLGPRILFAHIRCSINTFEKVFQISKILLDLKIQSENQCILIGVFNAFNYIVAKSVFVLISIINLFEIYFFPFPPLFLLPVAST